MRATTSESPHATAEVAHQLAAELAHGDLVLLEGDLGAGKTTFAKALCAALGVTAPVTSPTFVIAHRYEGDPGVIAHLDLHRLGTAGGMDRELIDDELDAADLAIVEWPSGAPGLGDRADWRVVLEHAGGDSRRIQVLRLRGDSPDATMGASR